MPGYNLDSKRLRQFLAVYEHGSIAAAADVLFLTQPALSKSIKALERELDVALFDRTPSGVKPTVFAETLAWHARRIVSELQSASSQISYMKGEIGGLVRIGVGPSAATGIMPGFLKRVAEGNADLTVKVVEGSVGDLVPALRKQELDFIVAVYPEAGDPELMVSPILKDRATVVARKGHPLAGSAGSSSAQLLDYPWILPPAHQSWRAALDGAFAARGLPVPQPQIISNSPTVILSVLRQSDMLSFLPGAFLADHGATIAHSLNDQITVDLQICIVHSAQRKLPPTVAHIVEMLREHVAQGSHAG